MQDLCLLPQSSEFICVWKSLFPWIHSTLLALKVFLSLLHQYLNPEENICLRQHINNCLVLYHSCSIDCSFEFLYVLSHILEKIRYTNDTCVKYRLICSYRHVFYSYISLAQWSSTFLLLKPTNIVPNVVVTPSHKIILLLLHNCNFSL